MEKLHTVSSEQLESNVVPMDRLNDLRTRYESTDNPAAERLASRESRRAHLRMLGERAARQDHAQKVLDEARARNRRKY